MVNQITINNIKSHKNTKLELGRLTLLVGPNSSGKSSILEALDSIYKIRHSQASPILADVPGPQAYARSGTKESIGVEVLFTKSNGTQATAFWRYFLPQDESSAGFKTTIRDEEIKFDGEAIFLRLDANKIAEPSVTDRAPPAKLNADGGYIANVVAEWKLADDKRLDSVIAALQKVVPGFERVSARPTMVTSNERVSPGYELLFDFVGAKDIQAKLVSEGTLIALGMLVAIKSANEAYFVLVDDIERALHPRAQVELVTILKSLLVEMPKLQILATTHSPYLLDAVDAKDVWVTALDANGVTVCSRLTDHPSAPKALNILTTGEFYSSEDPNWVTERKNG